MRTISQFLFDGFSFGYTIVTDDGVIRARAFTQNGLRKVVAPGLANLGIPVGGKASIYSLRPWRSPIEAGYAQRTK